MQNKIQIKANNRNFLVDAIKAFAIVLVVIAHCIQFGSGPSYLSDGSYFDNWLFKTITSFHMPLFMLVSGYLFAFSIGRYTTRSLILRRVKSLCLPIFSWAFVVLAIEIIGNCIHGGLNTSLGYIIHRYLYISFHHLWFLWALVWNSLIVLLVHKVGNDSIVIYLGILVISLVMPDVHNIYLFKFMYPFFVLGYFYSKNKASGEFVEKYENIILAISLFFFLCLVIQYNRETYIYTSGYVVLRDSGISYHQIIVDMHRFFVGLFGSLSAILVIRKCKEQSQQSTFKSFISYLGVNTLGIYIISDILFNAHLLRTISVNLASVNYGLVMGEVVATICVSLFAIKIIKKIPIVRVLFFGL